MDMITGNDISYAQGQIDWNTYKNNTDFVIIQSSYGVGNFDKWYGFNKGEVLKTDLPHGYYHFAYPDLNSPEDEANWFLHAVNAIASLQTGEVLFLDYERNSSDNVNWVKTFLDIVSKELGGYKPLLYTYQSMVTSNDFTPVASEGYGLWIAAPTNDPNNNNFQTGAFPFAAMQQWGVQSVPGISGDVDADVFFGDRNTFLAYGYKPIIESPPPVNTGISNTITSSSQPHDATHSSPITPSSSSSTTVTDESATPVSPSVQGNQQSQTQPQNAGHTPNLSLLDLIISWLIKLWPQRKQ